MAAIRGPRKEDILSSQRLIQQTKPLPVQAKEFIQSAFGFGMIVSFLGVMMIIIPNFAELNFIIGSLLYWIFTKKKFMLPMKLPVYSRMLDNNDLSLKDKKPQMASGLFYFGNEVGTRKELYLAKTDVCTHILMLATTGGGKTEALLSFAISSMAQGSGFTFVDGKADISLLMKVYGICRMFGREDDLLVINYSTGNVDLSFDIPEEKKSNTLNPFMFGSSSSLTQLLVSLMSGSDGKGDFWKDRAISLVEAIIPAMVWMRDKRGWLLDVSLIREYLNLSRVIELRKVTEMPNNIQDALRAYCENLAGWNERKGVAQGDQTLEQHGYLQMQFTRTLGSLGDVYGYIFKTPLGEVDMYDVITNRRILVVMLPALEKSTSELANLGRVMVALIKSMMASALGSRTEGDVDEVVYDRFTNSDTPYMTIFDEYGYYSVDGAAVMPAQARSLNISMIFAGQDYPSFKKSSEENAKAIMGNLNVKIFGKVEDAEDTFSLYKNQLGDVQVARASGFKKDTGFFSSFKKNDDVSIETVSRANLLNLKDKREGQMDIIFRSDLIHSEIFYANSPEPKNIRVNEFIKVRAPSLEALARVDESMNMLISNLIGGLDDIPEPADNLDIAEIVNGINLHQELNTIERSAAVIARYSDLNVAQARSIDSDDEDEDEDADEVFSADESIKKANVLEMSETDLSGIDDLMSIQKSMVDKESYVDNSIRTLMEGTIGTDVVSDQVRIDSILSVLNHSREEIAENIESISIGMGSTPVEAAQEADSLTRELVSSTNYPKHVPESLPESAYVRMIENFERDLDMIANESKDE